MNTVTMRKFGIFIVIFVLGISVVSTSSIASTLPNPGSSCSKLATSIISNGLKFTCTKYGNKLLWNSGVKVVTKSSVSPLKSTAPTSFADLDTHLDGIIYGAWFKGSQQVRSSQSVLGNVTILVGPNTKVDDSNSMASLKLASALYSNFLQVKNLYIIKFSKPDIAWAQQQYDFLHPTNYNPNSAQNYCSGVNGCDGGSTGLTSNGDGVILLGQGGYYQNQPIVEGGTRASNGQVVAHEYTHTIQMMSAPCSGSGCIGDLPQWMLEGNAEWSATVSRFSANFADYLNFRSGINGDLAGLYRDASMYTPEWINTFLNPSPIFLPNIDNWGYWSQYDHWDTYAFGFMVNEILVDLAGPDSVMNLYKDTESGMSFVQAFQQEFGKTWFDACPIISKAISDELKLKIDR